MLNEQQKEAFQREAKELEEKKREEGYMSTDLVALAYYLLKNNIDRAEDLEQSLYDVDDLIRRADELINKFQSP